MPLDCQLIINYYITINDLINNALIFFYKLFRNTIIKKRKKMCCNKPFNVNYYILLIYLLTIYLTAVYVTNSIQQIMSFINNEYITLKTNTACFSGTFM